MKKNEALLKYLELKKEFIENNYEIVKINQFRPSVSREKLTLYQDRVVSNQEKDLESITLT